MAGLLRHGAGNRHPGWGLTYRAAGEARAPRCEAVARVELQCDPVLHAGRCLVRPTGKSERAPGAEQNAVGAGRGRRAVVAVARFVHPDAHPVGRGDAGGIGHRHAAAGRRRSVAAWSGGGAVATTRRRWRSRSTGSGVVGDGDGGSAMGTAPWRRAAWVTSRRLRGCRGRLRRSGLVAHSTAVKIPVVIPDDGNCRRECNADPHGTSLRRARGGARLCSVGAGSGHCIRAPNGEREGVVRSGMSPQGVRPVV